MPDANPPALPVIDPSRALVEEELLRLAASRVFARAARQLRFLRHLVERTLGSDAAALREMALGVAIFHRSAERFDPRSDSIVRVEARRLRPKLTRFYADDGPDARLQFVLPTGGSLVEFRLRTVTGLDAAPRSSVAVVELVNLGGDEHRPLLAAIARALSSALSRLIGIRVVAYAEPASSDAECRRIARPLATETVLSGSMAVEADSVSISLQLQRAEDASLLWARQVSCPAMAFWKPGSRGGASTGVMPSAKHSRTTKTLKALTRDLQPQHPPARLASSNSNSGAQGVACKEA